MPDNIPISPGQGAVIATDQDPNTGAHYQRVKLVDGTEGSSSPIASDGQGSLQTYVTEADIEDLKTGAASVKVVNGPDEALHVRIVHQGRSQSGSCVPVVLASDHDPVPIASANPPLLGGALGATARSGVRFLWRALTVSRSRCRARTTSRSSSRRPSPIRCWDRG